MEEYSDIRQQIKNYLRQIVNPVIEPLVKEILQKRPNNLIKFIADYANQKIHQKDSAQNQIHSESDTEQTDQQKEFLKKLEQKKKKKIGKKISRQGISAQVFGQFNKKQNFKPRIIPKDKDAQEAIKKLIQKSILFESLNKQDLMTVIEAMEQVSVTVGQYVIKQGEKGDTLFIVASGEYECTKVIGGKETYLKTYKCGDSFGQLALMYNAPRAASIKCKTDGKMYGLDRSTFTNIIQEAAIKKRKANLQVLSNVQIFHEIDPYEKEQICDALVTEYFSQEDYIVNQGENGDRFYIVAEGKLIAQKTQNGLTPKKVFQYKEGDYFGQISLVKNTPRQASIKAVTDVRLVSIDREGFKRMLGPIQEILKRKMDKYRKYLDN